MLCTVFSTVIAVLRRVHSHFCLQVACMQFINIVVHSVENMNFRVHLQYEFTHLGLDKYLEVSTQSPAVQSHPFFILFYFFYQEFIARFRPVFTYTFKKDHQPLWPNLQHGDYN